MVIKYLKSLGKKFIWLLLASLYQPLFLISLSYPIDIIITNYVDIILLTSPWYIWIHQISFYGLEMRSYYYLNNKTAFLSILISTCLVMIVFPFSQFEIPSLNQIKPNKIIRNRSVFPSKNGSLVIIKTNELFAQKESKALWVGEYSLVANTISTNDLVARLSNISYFDGSSYQKQSENIDISLYTDPVLYKQIPGSEVFDLWQNSVKQLNHYLEMIYKSRDILLKTIVNHQLVLDQQKPKVSQFLHGDSASRTTNKNIKKNRRSTTKNIVSFEKYIEIFISIFNLMLLASLLGFLCCFNQNLLNTLSLIAIMALVVPFTMPLIEKTLNSVKLPIISELVLLATLIITITALIVIKRSQLEKKYAKNH
ncbi:MAG: hypothetical protein ACRCTJ_02400 [Brevinema sp.]